MSFAPAVPQPSALANLFSRLVAFSLPVTYFLVTVSFYLRTYDSAQIKITFTQIGCTLVIFFWLAQLALERRWPFSRQDLPVLAPFVALLLSGVVSFLQSSFRAGSVDEFLRRVLYMFMAIIVVVEFRGWERHRRLMRWLLAAFGVVVFYGLVQFFDTRLFPPGPGLGIDPFVWRQAFGQRVFSSFGNPNFYGNFLVVITPILLAFYLRSGGQIFRPYVLTAVMVAVVYFTDRLLTGAFGGLSASARGWVQAGLLLSVAGSMALVWWRTPSAAASGMLLFWAALFINLYATETKGAWMGFVAALTMSTILVAVFFTGHNARQLVRRLSVVVLVTVVLGASVVLYYARRRITSVNFRVFTWIATWEMIRTQPFFGSGVGTFKWAYPAYRRPEIIQIEGKSNTETDHAEDEYLEVWMDEGAVGFGIFLWLILTVSVLGVRALSQLTRQLAQGPPGLRHGERAFALLAFLGAWWGALVHWFVDVSVRFVSSGIYSGLLPGVVASLVRHPQMPVRQDAASSVDFWLRLGLAIFWTAVLMVLEISPFPALMCGVGVWLIGEIIEIRLAPEVADAPAAGSLTAADLERDMDRIRAWSWLAVVALLAAWVYGFTVFRNFFLADVHHNIAIFFSKQGVWAKSPEFDATVANFPPDMRGQYDEVGGAIENYEYVVRHNPFFPMARYFIGNVHNDWGSTIYGQSQDARQRGDNAATEALRKRAEEMWFKSLATYDRVKKFAPNYVQTHHQVGLVYLKLGEMEKSQGNEKKAQEYWDLAMKNFLLYRNLDPVFPPNYYRMAYIHFTRGEVDKAEKVYLDALTHNKQFPDRNAETYANLGRLFYIQLVNKHPRAPALPPGALEFKKAVGYYEAGVKEAERNPDYAKRWLVDCLKGMAVLYSRAGLQEKAVPLWHRLRALAPDDPDVRTVFGDARPR
jgi:tetratricopeptide (TPR) repeat protein